jgi:hypothetical protein
MITMNYDQLLEWARTQGLLKLEEEQAILAGEADSLIEEIEKLSAEAGILVAA